MVFAEHSTTGDGIVTALKMLDVMAEEGRSLADLASPLTVFPQVQISLKVTDKKAASADPEVVSVVNRITTELGTSGRVLMRHSDTESLIRIMVESEDPALCRKYADEIADAVKARGYLA